MKIPKFLKYASVAGLCVVSVSIAASQALCEDQTLKVAISGDIDNFDPATNQLIAFQAAIANTVFDSLVSYDENLKIVPRLAAAYDVSPDATVFTFDLVDGATFHNGQQVTAEAVVSSLKRSAKLGGVFGSPLKAVTSFEAPDQDTVVLTLDKPYAPFLTALTNLVILAPLSYENAVSEPIGSGPFKFINWTPNDRIILERNEGYWGQKPSYETLIFKPIPDPQVALTNLYAGEVDIVAEPSTAVIAQVDSSTAKVVRPSVSNSIVYIEMMGTKGTLANIHLRRALAYAFDRETIKAVAYGGQGDSFASPLPAGSFVYVDLKGYPYNLNKAKEEFKLSGAPAGIEINLEVLTGFPEAEQMGRVWQASLAQIGVKLNIVVSELSVWLDRYVSRNYDMTWNFFGVSPDPHSLFDVIMRPHLEGEYANQEMIDLVQAGIETSNIDERKAIYSKLQEIMVEDLPILAVQSRPIASIALNSIKDFAMNPLGWPLYSGVNKSE